MHHIEVLIGLNDIVTEGTMTWMDSSTSTYRNYYPGDPNGEPGDADIMRIKDLKWMDGDSLLSYPFLCSGKSYRKGKSKCKI